MAPKIGGARDRSKWAPEARWEPPRTICETAWNVLVPGGSMGGRSFLDLFHTPRYIRAFANVKVFTNV